MSSIEKLTEIFGKFPGIGPRQAKRFVYFLLTRNNGFVKEFSDSVLNLKNEIVVCPSCFRFFPKNKGENSLCQVCRDPNRDDSFLMVVSRDVDLENIEKSGAYNGKYFILGGTVPILEKEPEKRIRQKELLSCVNEKIKKYGLKEIILAMNVNPEGENTESYVKKILSSLLSKNTIKISTLGRGLSTGLELEYSDSDTLKNALKNRF